MYAAKAKRIIVVLLVLSVFAIATMMPACSSDPATAGMIAYGEGEVTTPRYRIWNGSAWESELSANDVGGVTNMVVLRSARTRDEKILGVLDKSGHINVQVWNGSVWGSVLEVTTAIGTTNCNYRGFDIAYEDSSGDAIIVYQNNTEDPLYRVWNGTGWSDAVTLDLPTAGFPVWIRLKSKPGADEIIVATLDKGSDVTAAVWDGSAWGNSVSLETETYTYETSCFAIAYESVSGDAMVAWSDKGVSGPQYIFWNTSTEWSAEATARETRWATYEFIELGSDPLSDNIVMGTMDSHNEANVNVWDGTAWGDNFEASNNVEQSGAKPADVGFESTSSEAVVAYAVKNDHVLHYRTWSAESNWSAQLSGPDFSNDLHTGDVRPDPNSDDIMLGVRSNDNYLKSTKWNGSACGTVDILENVGVSSNFAFFMLSYDRHFIISDVDAGGPYEAGDTISVTWNLTGSASATENYINVEYWDATANTQFDLTNNATSATSSTSRALTDSEAGHKINVYVYTASNSTDGNSNAITEGEPYPYSITEIQGPIITSCDKDGNEINQFAPGENVSVKGTGLDPNTNYTIWIQFDKVNESDAIDADDDPSTTSPKNETVKTDAEGNFSATLIWSIPTGATVTNTAYDIVVDNLESGTVGTYNVADDGLDSSSVAGIVAPVPDVSALVLFASGLMLAAVCFVRGGLKRDKRRGRS